MRKLLALAVLTLAFCVAGGLLVEAQNFPGASGNPSVLSRPGGKFYAAAFFWQGRIISGNTATGSASIIVAVSTGGSGGLQVADGTTIPLGAAFNGTLSPLIVDWGQSAAEYVTPTAVSIGQCPAGNIGVGGVVQCATITASFANTHGQSGVVVDGSYGLQTAINYANSLNAAIPPSGNSTVGGGVVAVDAAWAQMASSISNVTGGPSGGPNALITGAIPFPSVVIEDDRGSRPQFFTVQPANATAITAPAALINTTPTTCTGTATICSTANATLGGVTATWTSAAAYFATTCVDLLGRESAAGPTMHFTTAATVTVQVQPPAAETGCVGYEVYEGTSYAAMTRLPVVAGTTGGPTCVLTAIETVNPACAITNTIYGQTGAVATFALIGASTQPQPPGATITTFTTLQAFDQSRTVYNYQPNPSATNACNAATGYVSFAASTGTSGSAWELGRAFIAPGCLNYIGATVRLTGEITGTGNTVPTVGLVVAMGPPWTASAGASVCSMVNTTAQTAVVWNITFSCTVTTQTISVAAGTGGTVLGNGWFAQQFTTQTTAGNLAVNNIVAPVTVNLYGGTELEVILTPTSSTGITSPQLLTLNAEVL